MSRTDPRHVSDERHARLSAWARRKPRIGLMGEFSSGKSTLLNLLIGEDVLPTKVTATELPPVWFSHAEEPHAYWLDRSGRRTPLPFGDFRGVPMTARCVRVFTPSPMLERCDIIDTPGISDPNLAEDSWRFAVGQSNFIIWCTTATQAWRETERSTWLSLPTRLRDKSVLAVTRADKLAGPNDREKVTRRLMRETFGFFGGLVMLSSVDAVRGQELFRATGDMSLWDHSGGRELDQRIEAGLRAVLAERLDLLDRYVATGPEYAPTFAEEPEPSLPEEPTEEPEVPAALLRLFGQPEPVRPRRVEVPESRRSERPAEAADPMNGLRAGWNALREPEPEPAPVVHLTERADRPAPRSLWIEEDEDQPLVVLPAAPMSSAPTLAVEEPTAEELVAEEPVAVEPESPIDLVPAPDHAPRAESVDPVQAVLAAMTEPAQPAAPPAPVAPPAEALPRAVRVWRDIVARASEVPQNDPVVAMIDQLLFELSRDSQLSGAFGSNGATIGQDQAA